LGGRKAIRPVKKLGVGTWYAAAAAAGSSGTACKSYARVSEFRLLPQPSLPSSLAAVKSRMV